MPASLVRGFLGKALKRFPKLWSVLKTKAEAKATIFEHIEPYYNIKRRHSSTCSRSFLWAFSLKDFELNRKIVQCSFIEYSADKTDLSFLLDYELVLEKHLGIQEFV